MTTAARAAPVLDRLDDLLRAIGGLAPVRTSALVGAGLLAAAAYGAVMSSWRTDTPERLLLPLFGAIKTPLLIITTTALCLPGFFVLNTVLRLRADFAAALRAILAAQAALALALVSLAPVTKFVYFCGANQREALLFNALMFAIATLLAQIVILRRYRPLLARARAHAACLAYWLAAYAFVGIQMGWMLRPFVGSPGLRVAFLRDEPFTNAYVVVWGLVFGH